MKIARSPAEYGGVAGIALELANGIESGHPWPNVVGSNVVPIQVTFPVWEICLCGKCVHWPVEKRYRNEAQKTRVASGDSEEPHA